LVEEVSFLGRLPRQERAVEREASWGITKLMVDRGRAIDVIEVLAAAAARAGVGVERAGACPLYEELFLSM
jgi:hypothetical protein